MKVTHTPIPSLHGGPQADDRLQGGSEPPTKTPEGAAPSEDTAPAVSVQLSEDAQQHVAPATTDVKPGNSGNSPAHQAKAAMETYSELGEGPFGQLVSQIARGVFTEPTPDGEGEGEGEPGPGATTDGTTGETTPDGATEPAPDGETVVTGDEPAAEGETVVTGDEPAPDGETVVTGDEPAPDGETVAAGDEPAAEGEPVVAGGTTESLAAAAIVADAAAIDAELIDELLEETTAE